MLRRGGMGVLALLTVVGVLLGVGCAKRESAGPVMAASAPAMPMAQLASMRGEGSIRGEAGSAEKRRTLAYEHEITIELSQDRVAKRAQAVQEACNSRKELECTLLDVAIRMEDAVPSGRIVMRLAPGGVAQLTAVASEGGEVISRTTHAEDLAEPVADTERALSQLSIHRERLTELMNNKSIGINQLIALSKELASVQSQIDELSTRKANLNRRIDTELLTINFSMPRAAILSRENQISDAFAEFGPEFKGAIANVIRFVAVLVPWLVVILPCVFLLRWFWRMIGRWFLRREA